MALLPTPDIDDAAAWAVYHAERLRRLGLLTFDTDPGDLREWDTTMRHRVLDNGDVLVVLLPPDPKRKPVSERERLVLGAFTVQMTWRPNRHVWTFVEIRGAQPGDEPPPDTG